MTDALRRKLRPFVEQLVTTLVDEAVERIETTARDRLRAALDGGSEKAARTPQSANALRTPKKRAGAKRQKSKIARTPRIALERSAAAPRQVATKAPIVAQTRHQEPLRSRDDLERQLNEAADLAAQSPATRPCGCSLRGRHRKTCSFGQLIAKPKVSPPTPKVAADDDEPDTFEPPNPTARADRFAKIEASAQKRTGTLPTPSSSFRTEGRL
jgi:hypothetical protein